MDMLTNLLLGTKTGIKRLAVEVGQFSLLEGKQFRTFIELSLPV